MKVINSYIFIPKNSEKKLKDNTIRIGYNAIDFFERCFCIDHIKVEEEQIKNHSKRFFKESLKDYSGISRGSFNYSFCEKEINIEYKFIKVDDVYYLDIIINNKKEDVISALENINSILITDKNFKKEYITIISYDYISEYYCNKLYPLLNTFERKFRKLLFLIFTAQFKNCYFEQVATEEMIIKAKENMKEKKGVDKKEYRTQNYFYSLDIGMLRDFLFKKSWTSFEEKQKEKLLNKDFTKIDGAKVKKMIEELEPKSNWDRFFDNKGFPADIDISMKNINELRNIVAHSKIMDKDQFNQLYQLLNDNLKYIDKAIKITETKDFIIINKKKHYEIINSIGELISKALNSIDYKKTMNNMFDTINEIALKQKQIVDAFMEGINKYYINDKKETKTNNKSY